MPDNLHQLITEKRKWSEPLGQDHLSKGFKGWYSSKYLPHFDKLGIQQFITYRLADSLPLEHRSEWEPLLRANDDRTKQRHLELYFDRGLGACHLRDPRIAELVQENLWYHDGQSYRLLAWVIMPNHVHALIEVWEVSLGRIVKSWKSFTAKQADRILGRTGKFWQEDYFDRYVRDERNFWQFVRYIESNPVKAGLVRAAEDWPWSSARYRSKEDITAQTLTHPGGGPHNRSGDGSSPC